MKRSSARLTTGVTLTLAVLGLTACSQAGRGSQPAAQPSAPSAAAVVPAASEPSPVESSSHPEESAVGVIAGTEPGGNRCQGNRHWTTARDDGGLAMSTSAFYLTRAGRHQCFDRVVFDVNGPAAVGFSARYVPVVRADGSGFAVPVSGNAALEIVVRAPITDDGGHQPGRPPVTVGTDLVPQRMLADWTSLATVKYAGSFEGQTTIAVGVREKRPFRMWTMVRQGHRHVVLDVAH